MSEAQSPTRTVDGRDLPTPGTFSLDSTHSEVSFSVRHMMIAKVRGRFGSVSGTIELAEDPLASTVQVEVEVSSIDTGEEQRDGHLVSADFFDAESHPKITFKSTKVTPAGGDKFTVDGELTVHGVTKPVSLSATFNGLAQDPWGNQRIGFDATTELNREDFGLTWNQVLETGGVMISKDARIGIEAEFVRN